MTDEKDDEMGNITIIEALGFRPIVTMTVVASPLRIVNKLHLYRKMRSFVLQWESEVED